MDRYEQRLRRALRCYPRHYREQPGEEIIATTLELRESDTTADERWGLVKAGLLTRLRERPPFLRWLAYRSLDTRVPPRYRMWVRDDVLGRWYALRRLVAVVGVSSLVLIPLSYVTNPGGGLVSFLIDPVEWSSWSTVWITAPTGIIVGVWAAALSVLSLATAGHYRRTMLRKHGFPPTAHPRPRRSRAVRTATGAHWATDPSGHGARRGRGQLGRRRPEATAAAVAAPAAKVAAARRAVPKRRPRGPRFSSGDRSCGGSGETATARWYSSSRIRAKRSSMALPGPDTHPWPARCQ